MSHPLAQAHSVSWSGNASPTRRQASLVQQASGQVMERHGAGIGQSRRRGVAVELLVGVVLSIVVAVLVALAGGAMNESAEPAVRNVIVPVIEEEIEDLDPRDPLVRCTVLETHTHCIREAS